MAGRWLRAHSSNPTLHRRRHPPSAARLARLTLAREARLRVSQADQRQRLRRRQMKADEGSSPILLALAFFELGLSVGLLVG